MTDDATLPDGAEKSLNAHLWARDEHDWYVEHPEVSAALFRVEKFEDGEIYDPACGRGNIVRSAQEAGYYPAWGTDIEKRSDVCRETLDFMDDGQTRARSWNIVTNPPFKFCGKAEKFKFLVNILACTRLKAAVLMPATWKNSLAAADFYQANGLFKVYDLVPRPSMPPGAVIEAGIKPGGGTNDFSWYIFQKGYRGPWTGEPLRWKA